MECLSSCRLGRTPSALAVAPEDVLGWFYQAQRPSGLWPAGICGPHAECTVLEMAYILYLLTIFFKRWKSPTILFPLASRLAHWKDNSCLLLHFCSLHFRSGWPFSVLYSFLNNLYYKRMVWGVVGVFLALLRWSYLGTIMSLTSLSQVPRGNLVKSVRPASTTMGTLQSFTLNFISHFISHSFTILLQFIIQTVFAT